MLSTTGWTPYQEFSERNQRPACTLEGLDRLTGREGGLGDDIIGTPLGRLFVFIFIEIRRRWRRVEMRIGLRFLKDVKTLNT